MTWAVKEVLSEKMTFKQNTGRTFQQGQQKRPHGRYRDGPWESSLSVFSGLDLPCKT